MRNVHALLVFAALLALAGCQNSADNSTSGKTPREDLSAQWDAVYKPGNWWSVEVSGLVHKYKILSVNGDMATVAHSVALFSDKSYKEEDIVVVKPQVVGDPWRDPTRPWKETGHGEEKIGEWDCYYTEYETTTDDSDSRPNLSITADSGIKFHDKVWRHKEYGIVVKQIQNNQITNHQVRELHIK